MSIRQLETLIAIAETGGFAAAADRLAITQSAISMQIKALEEDLGTPLFDRTRRPPVLNATGASILEQARDVVSRYRALKALANAPGDVAGTLTMGIIPTASTGLMPDALAILRDRFPRLQVRVESGLSTGLVRRVADGDMEAALVTGAGRLPRGLRSRPVLTEKLMVIAGSAAGERTDDALLESQPFIRFNRQAGVGRVIDSWLRRRRIRVRETMELDSIEAMVGMVARGLGVAVVPERSLAGVDPDTVLRIPFCDPPATRQVSLVDREGGDHEARARAVFDALVEATETPV